MKLEIGIVYVADFDMRPVMYKGSKKHEEGGVYHQFEYIMPKDLPQPNKGGVIGYGISNEQMLRENYKVQVSLTTLFGKNGVT